MPISPNLTPHLLYGHPLCGIDLGGTKTEIVVISNEGLSDSGTIRDEDITFRERKPTPQDLGFSGILENIRELLEAAEAKCGRIPALGISHPGTIDPHTGLMRNSNTISLNDQPFKQSLEELIGRPCYCANDANCFALAESLWGAARNYETVFGVILGTGVGGGIVKNQVVHAGRQGLGGEWGHNVLLPNGFECYCGKRGCVETVFSGPALERLFHKKTGMQLTFKEVVNIASRSAESGESLNDARLVKASDETIEWLIDNCATALSVVINILDPDCIVLGGGVSNVPHLAKSIHQRLQNRIFHSRCNTVVTKNELGDSAGVYGAALLSRDNC